jgi:3-dehydroquinate synthase
MINNSLSITVNVDGRLCPVFFSQWRRRLQTLSGKTRRAVVISNPTVFALHGKTLLGEILPPRWTVIPLMIGDGERFKSERTVAAVYDHLCDLSVDRDDLIVAFGGGVVGDTAGFAAATFKRGIDFIQVPTTLLAMVDSAVGAKVGIDHRHGKNLIGTFHQPQAIVINPTWLATLPRREMAGGRAELIKTGFLVSRNFLQAVLSMPTQYDERDRRKWKALMEGAILFKAEIVARDPFDRRLRKVLNFGHTFAHAIETAEGYRRYRHGEAVLAGMAAALYLSRAVGHLSEKRLVEYLQYLRGPIAGLPPLSQPTAAYLTPMRFDKKNSGEGLTFVLLEAIGCPVLCSRSTERDIRNALARMKAFVASGGRI